MIEINLVPPQLRKKRKREGPLKGVNIPAEMIIGLVGGVVVLLLAVNLLVQVIIFVKLFQYKSLKGEWDQVAASKTNLDIITTQLRDLQSKAKSVEVMTGGEGIHWAGKMSYISESLPRGVWLRKIVVSKQRLGIEGSAISKGKDEITNVHTFASNLKNQPTFMDRLDDLEVGSIQRRTVKTVEIVDFSITTKIK